ncbi:MAG: hypothetical protein ACOC1V_04510 [Candidatus Saliniplasma sp.]
MNSEKNRTDNSHISIISDSSNRSDQRSMDIDPFKTGLEGFVKVQLILIIVLLAFMFLIGNPGQWIVGLIILGLVGANIVYHLYGRSDKLDTWQRKNELDEIVHLKISRTSEIAKSAFKGKELSQAILEEKLIEEFLKKIMDKKNLTESEVKYLLDHPYELKKVVGDDELSSFVLKGKSLKKVLQNMDDDVSKKVLFRKIKEDKAYKKKIDRLIKKMEEWN